MTTELIKQFLEAGLHFGHQTKRWDPRMKKYIYGERNGVYIIDLQKTVQLSNNACDFLKDITSEGNYVLFVGTKKQAQTVIGQEAQRCGMFYVNKRWLGGTLTNFETVRKSVKRLNKIKTMQEDGTFNNLSKKEVARLSREFEKLNKNLSGVVKMNKLPGALFIIDPKRENIAVKEANRLKIPVVSLIDTNCDPVGIDYPIPGNDDAIRAIKLIIKIVTDSIIEGRQEYLQTEETKRLKQENEESEKVSENQKEKHKKIPQVKKVSKKVKKTAEQSNHKPKQKNQHS